MTDYLNWQSDLTLEQVFAASNPFSYPDFSVASSPSKLVYLSHLIEDNGRAALILQESDRCISPAPFNLRTKINEYGGKPYWLDGEDVIFANQSDQCLYRQPLLETGVKPVRISPAPTEQASMYSDVSGLSESVLIAIIEQEVAGAENQSYIGWLNPCLLYTSPSPRDS